MARTVTDTQIKRMYALYKGLQCAYGTYDMSSAFYEGKKLRGVPKSISEAVEETTFDEKFWYEKIKTHLSSDVGVGIVPVNEDSKCFWGCIDVDKYDLNYEEVLLKVAKYDFPLVTTVTKSGGVHLYLFLEKAAPAFLVINYLKNIRAQLGYADEEVFPKQTKILHQNGDSGSWVNIPMLGDGTRHCIKLVEGVVTEIRDLDEFLNYAESKRLPKLTTSEITIEKEQVVPTGNFKEAPPCLQALMAEGFPEGSRNVIMYNIAVYLKKAYGEKWEAEFEKFNQMYCEEPLHASEIISVQKSVARKDYNYQCSQQPLCSYCNVTKCKQVKFGLRDTSLELKIESLAKLDAKPAIWFASIGDSRIQLTTDQLADQKKFQLACMEELNRMPPRIKDVDWAAIIDNLIQEAVIIPAAPDAGSDGTFHYLLEEYCSKMAGTNREDLLRKRAFVDPEDGFTYFALTDFMIYLKQNKFNEFIKSAVSAKIKDMGGGSKAIHVLGKCKHTHFVPSYAMQESKFTVPDTIHKNEDLI